MVKDIIRNIDDCKKGDHKERGLECQELPLLEIGHGQMVTRNSHIFQRHIYFYDVRLNHTLLASKYKFLLKLGYRKVCSETNVQPMLFTWFQYECMAVLNCKGPRLATSIVERETVNAQWQVTCVLHDKNSSMVCLHMDLVLLDYLIDFI